jgi:hypothetical protein
MKIMWEKIQPADIMAILLIVMSLILKLKGLDGKVDLILTAVAAYYLGHGRIIQNQP